MSGNKRQCETNILFNNKFLLNLLQSITFWLIYLTTNNQIVLQWLECRHGNICVTLRHWSMPSSITLRLTHQPDAAWNRSHSELLSDRHVAPDSVVNWIRSGLFSGHKSGSSYGWQRSLRLLHFRTADCLTVDTACVKKITTSRIYQKR